MSPERANLFKFEKWRKSLEASSLDLEKLRTRYHSYHPSSASNDQAYLPHPDSSADHLPWECAMVALEIGQCLLDAAEWDCRQEAVKALTTATKVLCTEYPAESRRLDVHALLAHAHHAAEEHLAALEHAEIAVRQNPLSITAHREIAVAYLALKEYDRATLSYQEAIRCDPDDVDARLGYASAAASAGLRCHDKGHRLELLQTAAGLLQRAVDLCELRFSQDRSEHANGVERPRPRPNELRDHKCEVHYWLGRVRYEQHRYQDAINQFVIARALGESCALPGPLLGLYLGQAQLRIGVSARAETTFVRALEQLHLTSLFRVGVERAGAG